MSEFTTSDCVTVEVTMVFLCPFLGEKKEAYNDEKRNTVNDLVEKQKIVHANLQNLKD